MRAGCFELAEGGTLLLDEIARCHRCRSSYCAIEERSVRRLGSRKRSRLTYACWRQPPGSQTAVPKGPCGKICFTHQRFHIHLPSLNDRRKISRCWPSIWSTAWRRNTRGRAAESAALSPQFHAWPGNVRELRNDERAVVICSGEQVERHHFAPYPIDQREREMRHDNVPVGTPIEKLNGR